MKTALRFGKAVSLIFYGVDQLQNCGIYAFRLDFLHRFAAAHCTIYIVPQR